jgi:GNAT superfamily N-acetyltransferase
VLDVRQILERLGRLFGGHRSDKPGPAGPVPTHALPDGTPVIIRAIEPSDAEAMAEAFGRLSGKSRYQRFLNQVDRLTSAELEYLSRVDGDHHLALGMAVIQEGVAVPVAIARCIRESGEPDLAEVAFVVADEWHGRGVARLLVQCLAERARAVGIRRWKAVMLAENTAARRLLEHAGSLLSRRMEGAGVVEEVRLLGCGETEKGNENE